MTMNEYQRFEVGQRITAGHGDDRDSGVVGAICGDQVTVQWDSGVVTSQSAAALCDDSGDEDLPPPPQQRNPESRPGGGLTRV